MEGKYSDAICMAMNDETVSKVETISKLWGEFDHAVENVGTTFHFTPKGDLTHITVRCFGRSDEYVYSVHLNSIRACFTDTLRAMLKCADMWR